MIGGCGDGEYFTVDTDREFVEVQKPYHPLGYAIKDATTEATCEMRRSYYRPMMFYHGHSAQDYRFLVEKDLTFEDVIKKLIAGYKP